MLVFSALHILFAIYFVIRLITVTPCFPHPSTLPALSITRFLLLACTPLFLLINRRQLFTIPLITSYAVATLHALRFSIDAPLLTFTDPTLAYYPRLLLWRVDTLAYFLYFCVFCVFCPSTPTLHYFFFPFLVLSLAATVTTLLDLYVRARHQSSSPTLRHLLHLAFNSSSPSPPPVAAAPPCLRNASLYTLISFNWVSNLVATGHSRPLEIDDVLPLAERFKARNTVQHFRHVYESERLRAAPGKPSLFRVLYRAYGLRVVLVCVLGMLRFFVTFTTPILLRYIILHLENRANGSANSWQGVYLSCALLVILFFQTVLAHQFFDMMCCTIAYVRGALNNYIYDKSARLSIQSRSTYTTGQIQNLMVTDAFNVAEATLDLSFMVVIIQQTCVILVLLLNLVGWMPTIALTVLIIAYIPLQAWLLSVTKDFREAASSVTDERVKLVSEAIKGIKLVKLYAWECPFMNKILQTRDNELDYVRKVAIAQAWNSVLVTSMPTLFILTVFATHVATGNALDAALVFPIIAMFNLIRPTLIYLPAILLSIARGVASLSRLEKFFNAEELASLNDGEHAMERNLMELTKTDVAAHEASFAWDTSLSPLSLTLSSISFEIPEGSLVAIVGPTGSGKSSLLAGLLGELPIVAGRAGVRSNRSISYCDQVPFIQNATLRENILFGKPFEEEHYWKTVRVCSLEPDLEILPARDQTEIGGRGVNLSGGQRARVSLARAVYSRADICLLDDPLCAVDARVGKSIFTKCIVSALRGTTRLLTTNQIHFAASPDVDLVVVVKDGKIIETGSRELLLSRKSSEFAQLIEASGEVGAGDVLNTTVDDDHVTRRDLIGQMRQKSKVYPEAKELDKLSTAGNEENDTLTNGKTKADYGSIKGWRLTKQETKEEGRVRLQHYATYLRALGLWRWVMPCLFFSFCTKVLSLGVDVWLSSWSEQDGTDNTFFYLAVFLGLGVFSVVTTGGAIFSLAYGSIRASGILHEDLLLSAFGAPISFFHATPEGQIINRFHSDVDKVDSLLVPTITSMLRLILNLVFTIGLMLWATPLVLVVIIPTAAVCLYIQEFYRRCSVDIRRLESVAKSPLYSHFCESLDGIVTIRAYQDVPRGSRVNSEHADNLSKVSYATYYANRWLGVRLESVSSILVFLATILAVSTSPERLSPSTTGLVLSYVMQMLGAILSTVRQFTLLESYLSSVERISEYSAPSFQREEKGGLENLFKELKGREKLVARNELTELKCEEKVDQLDDGWRCDVVRWPREGRIAFEKVEMRYRADLEPALRNISFSVRPGEHIGVVGRTGAGKSSAIHCLFRLHELGKGRILVDGTDISGLRLYYLRSSIGIIPQEPVCFSGTIWSNLDMSEEHDETDVQRALDACGLQSTTNRKVTLKDEVAENGSNLSVGQRQLLCLGRVLLKDSQILVLDEATSSVTNETDEIIQKTLRDKMKQCTILTIAHRLHTVMKSDRIIVMEKGEIAEIGKPSQLLNQKSKLSGLVDETGPATAAHLRRMASLSREIKNGKVIGSESHQQTRRASLGEQA